MSFAHRPGVLRAVWLAIFREHSKRRSTMTPSMNTLPARLAELNPDVNALHPAQVGVSKKTLQNIKANLVAAIRVAGVSQSSAALIRDLSPEWKVLHGTLHGKRMKNGLSRFIRYCSHQGTDPTSVTDVIVSERRCRPSRMVKGDRSVSPANAPRPWSSSPNIGCASMPNSWLNSRTLSAVSARS